MIPRLRFWLLLGAMIAISGLALTAKAFYHAKKAAEARAEILSLAVDRAEKSVTRSLQAVKDRDRVLRQRELVEQDLTKTLTEAQRKLREAYRNDQDAAEWAPRRVPDAFLDGLRVRPGGRDGSGPDPASRVADRSEAGT